MGRQPGHWLWVDGEFRLNPGEFRPNRRFEKIRKTKKLAIFRQNTSKIMNFPKILPKPMKSFPKFQAATHKLLLKFLRSCRIDSASTRLCAIFNFPTAHFQNARTQVAAVRRARRTPLQTFYKLSGNTSFHSCGSFSFLLARAYLIQSTS